MSAAEPTKTLWSSLDGLGTLDLYALLKLRCDVFVVEQRCPYPDVDGRDGDALHLLAWLAEDAPLAGYLRLFGPVRSGSPAWIGRVATSAAARGRGLGRWLMAEGLAEAARRYGQAAVAIDAQTAMERFYASLGFIRVSDDFDEDGIVHCTMLREPA